MIVPLIVIVETCSWYAVTTASNQGHVLEESLWGAGAALMTVSLVAIWSRCDPARRPLLAAVCGISFAYIACMYFVDMPMYWTRWLADEGSERAYMSVTEGVLDASARWAASHEWEDWKNEIVWKSLYFSGAVWMSIAVIHPPPLKGFIFDDKTRLV